jgi:nitrate reductase gamma subunit
VILLHMLAGEIMLMAIPFTKLVHMPFFFINRFLLVHENTFGAGGSRIWR